MNRPPHAAAAASMTRRRFIQATAAAATGALVIPRSAFGANNRLNVAVIGCTGRGGDNYGEVMQVENVQIVALCDVDDGNLARGLKKRPKARPFNDYRRMLDEMGKEIDAVVVSTPDHHHAPASIRALKMGKHVYCEKPLTHTVEECRKVRRAAAEGKLATQMGTQIHATENYRRVVELVKVGAVGKVQRVHVWVGGGWTGGDQVPSPAPAPDGLHWDLWLGPAQERPYAQWQLDQQRPGIMGTGTVGAYHPFNWRGWWDFGGGHLADMACHHMDLSHWALDLRYADSIETEGPPVHPHTAPAWLTVHYRYPARGEQPPVHLTWYHGLKENRPKELSELGQQGEVDPKQWNAGTLFIGDKGMLIADYGKHKLLPADRFKDYQQPAKSIPPSIGHHAEWVKACREGTPTTCNFDYSGALTETVLLGNVAYRLGKKLEWDAEKLTATNAPEAEQLIRKSYRKGWEV